MPGFLPTPDGHDATPLRATRVVTGDDGAMSAEPAPIIVVSGPSGVGKSAVSRLVAAAFEWSAIVPTDILRGFVVNGWLDPWLALAEAQRQHEVIGGVLAVAAMQFAKGGYTTVVDGHLFPRGVEGLAATCTRRSVPLHYVVLRADLATCWARARRRGEGRWLLESGTFDELHAKFAEVGAYEQHVIDATGPSEDVAARVLTALRDGRLTMSGQPSAGSD